MKNGLILGLLALLLFTACSDNKPEATEPSRVQFTLSHSSYDDLYQLENQLSQSEGVMSVKVFPEENRVEVIFDKQLTDSEEIILVLDELPASFGELPVEPTAQLKRASAPELINKDVLFEKISFPSIFDALILAYRKSGGYSHH
ncbi:heavy-metal-associated domain-containing protein [bacterium SCSIO 12741]|nr:heavy-metal-associated domain-containing protein [bacterium SCSIO 12741]